LAHLVENHHHRQVVTRRYSRGGWLRPMRRDNVAAAQKEAPSQFARNRGKLVLLPSATKDALKAALEFDYAN
jgi:hypothetical protein